ncbi:MAG: hypothetical protein MJA82_02265 [Clostridia bacterium]|nr:hypothetical protein [Clostridia bacterium]
MGLPSYIINWEELKELLEDALGDLVVRSIRDVKGVQRVWGSAQSVPALRGNYKILEWTLNKNIVITGITYSQSAWKGEDYWELWVDGDRLFETVYTKELGEQKHWEVLHPINEGQTIKVVLHNVSGNSRNVWVDVEYLDLLGDVVTP